MTPRSIPSAGLASVMLATALVSFMPAAAHADILVTAAQPTSAIACAAGTCAPTAPMAVLNVTDLQSMLAAANVAITTHGSAGIEAGSIRVESPLQWSAQTLTLTARKTVAIFQPVTVAAAGRLSLTTNDGATGGRLRFGRKGYVTFKQSQGALTINATPYTLEPDLASLAAAIAQNPAGHYALPHGYDASAAGTYTASPIPTTLTGTVEGLGNTVSNLTIAVNTPVVGNVGLFSDLGGGSLIENLSLNRANITAAGGPYTGILSALMEDGAAVSGVHAAGNVSSGFGPLGSIAGENDGTIEFSDVNVRAKGELVGGIAGETQADGALIEASAAGGTVITAERGSGGGIVGEFEGGNIVESYSTATIKRGFTGSVGGLVGELNGGNILNSYALGPVLGKGDSSIGGLAGYGASYIQDSYASNMISTTGSGSLVGGVYGIGSANASDKDIYWNLSVSGIDVGTGQGNVAAIHGLTTMQLQSGLPPGFDPSIWGENSNINGGLPYLLLAPSIR